MNRLSLIALAFIPIVGLAAPIPPETDAARLERIYGVWEDPEKDCRHEMIGERLRISIPASVHDFDDLKKRQNAPRVLREVEGDFVVSVGVDFTRHVDLTAVHPSEEPRAAGGILVWGDEDRYFLATQALELSYDLSKPAKMMWVTNLWQPRFGSGWRTDSTTASRRPAYIRVQRIRNKIIVFNSANSIAWTHLMVQFTALPAKVKVGVFAQHNLAVQFEADFNGYTLTQSK